jgi:hypothetical protein
MANRTAWTAGNGVGLIWTAAFASGDLTSLANGSFILSSASVIANGSNLDIYADFSVICTVTSATPPAGAYLAVYLVPLLGDGSTYGDGLATAGTAITRAPPYPPAGAIALEAAIAATTLAGFVQGIIIPPGTFSWGLYNGSGAALSSTAASNKAFFRTYNMNLNN